MLESNRHLLRHPSVDSPFFNSSHKRDQKQGENGTHHIFQEEGENESHSLIRRVALNQCPPSFSPPSARFAELSREKNEDGTIRLEEQEDVVLVLQRENAALCNQRDTAIRRAERWRCELEAAKEAHTAQLEHWVAKSKALAQRLASEVLHAYRCHSLPPRSAGPEDGKRKENTEKYFRSNTNPIILDSFSKSPVSPTVNAEQSSVSDTGPSRRTSGCNSGLGWQRCMEEVEALQRAHLADRAFAVEVLLGVLEDLELFVPTGPSSMRTSTTVNGAFTSCQGLAELLSSVSLGVHTHLAQQLLRSTHQAERIREASQTLMEVMDHLTENVLRPLFQFLMTFVPSARERESGEEMLGCGTKASTATGVTEPYPLTEVELEEWRGSEKKQPYHSSPRFSDWNQTSKTLESHTLRMTSTRKMTTGTPILSCSGGDLTCTPTTSTSTPLPATPLGMQHRSPLETEIGDHAPLRDDAPSCDAVPQSSLPNRVVKNAGEAATTNQSSSVTATVTSEIASGNSDGGEEGMAKMALHYSHSVDRGDGKKSSEGLRLRSSRITTASALRYAWKERQPQDTATTRGLTQPAEAAKAKEQDKIKTPRTINAAAPLQTLLTQALGPRYAPTNGLHEQKDSSPILFEEDVQLQEREVTKGTATAQRVGMSMLPPSVSASKRPSVACSAAPLFSSTLPPFIDADLKKVPLSLHHHRLLSKSDLSTIWAACDMLKSCGRGLSEVLLELKDIEQSLVPPSVQGQKTMATTAAGRRRGVACDPIRTPAVTPRWCFFLYEQEGEDKQNTQNEEDIQKDRDTYHCLPTEAVKIPAEKDWNPHRTTRTTFDEDPQDPTGAVKGAAALFASAFRCLHERSLRLQQGLLRRWRVEASERERSSAVQTARLQGVCEENRRLLSQLQWSTFPPPESSSTLPLCRHQHLKAESNREKEGVEQGEIKKTEHLAQENFLHDDVAARVPDASEENCTKHYQRKVALHRNALPPFSVKDFRASKWGQEQEQRHYGSQSFRLTEKRWEAGQWRVDRSSEVEAVAGKAEEQDILTATYRPEEEDGEESDEISSLWTEEEEPREGEGKEAPYLLASPPPPVLISPPPPSSILKREKRSQCLQ